MVEADDKSSPGFEAKSGKILLPSHQHLDDENLTSGITATLNVHHLFYTFQKDLVVFLLQNSQESHTLILDGLICRVLKILEKHFGQKLRFELAGEK